MFSIWVVGAAFMTGFMLGLAIPVLIFVYSLYNFTAYADDQGEF